MDIEKDTMHLQNKTYEIFFIRLTCAKVGVTPKFKHKRRNSIAPSHLVRRLLHFSRHLIDFWLTLLAKKFYLKMILRNVLSQFFIVKYFSKSLLVLILKRDNQLDFFRSLEKCSKRLTKCEGAIEFLRLCLNFGVTPTFAQVERMKNISYV